MNADSVKAKLKNFAINSGCTFQEALVYYGLERTIYRISVSPYASHTYSLESSIAEKLEAIVKNGFLNSRYKDFYDIYVLSEK